jgi:hypothetical protein
VKPTAAGEERGRSTVGIAGIVMAGMVLLVATASRHALLGGHRLQASRGGDFNWLLDTVTGVLAVAAGIGLVAYIVALWPAGGRRGRLRSRSPLATILVMAAMVSLLELQVRYHLFHRTRRVSSPLPGADARSASSLVHHVRSVAHLPLPVVVMLTVVGVAIGGVLLVGPHGRWGPAVPAEPDATREDSREEIVARAAWDSLDDLRSEPDARRAVVAAYARMERGLLQAGLPRSASDTPMEYLARALVAMRASGVAVTRLTSLFEAAKFGHHPVGEDMRAEAIRALEDIARTLAAPV